MPKNAWSATDREENLEPRAVGWLLKSEAPHQTSFVASDRCTKDDCCYSYLAIVSCSADAMLRFSAHDNFVY